MINKEKIIEGLEWILEDDRFGFGINWETGEPRDDYEKAGKIITDTIAMLKRQQPEPVRIGRFPVENKLFSHCPRCGLTLDEFIHQPSELRPLYCPIYGQAVKWDE